MKEKILVIKLGALGDFILATGAFRAIRQQYPDAQIDLLTGASLVRMADQMDIFSEIHVDHRVNGNPREWYRICKTIIADGNYDIIFDLQGSSRTRIRYYYLSALFGRRANWQAETGEIMNSMPHVAPSLDFCRGEEKHFHLLPERYALLYPGCSAKNSYKRWPKEKYAELAKELSARGIRSVVAGTDAEREEIEYICSAVPDAVNFMGKSSLLDIPRLAANSVCTVGNDTGPTHMATLAGAVVVSLFCERSWNEALGKYGARVILRPLIDDITVDDVLTALSDTI